MRGLALAVSIAIGGLLLPGPAVAQGGWWSSGDDRTPSREVFLGAITTGGGEAQRQETTTGVADQLLSDGLEALARGDILLGRRRLEAVVDAYPQSPAAEAARKELRTFYDSRRPSGSGAKSPVYGYTGSDVSRSGGQGASSREAVERERQARLDERRLVALGHQFQAATGDRIFFGENSAEPTARARALLAAQARWLARHPDVPIVIEAHADDSSGTNRDLDIQISERRGRAVQERLIEAGIDPRRIKVVSFGRDRPVAICQAPECAAQNRRVVTRIAGLPSMVSQRRGIEEPALATIPSRGEAGRRD